MLDSSTYHPSSIDQIDVGLNSRQKLLSESLLNLYSLSLPEVSLLCGCLGQARLSHPGEKLARDRRPYLLLEGWAIEQAVLKGGRRQIIRVILPGDILVNEDNASVVALTEMILAPLDLREIDPGVISRFYDAVARRQSKTYRDRLIRLGCLTGKERFALFLLDIYNRLEHMGRATAGVIDPWPLSQNLMADAIGLTSVHVNRLLQQLRRADMLTAKRSRIELQLGKLSAFAASFADIGVEASPNVVCRPRMEGWHTQDPA